jgi:proline iminopeptidase
MRLLLLLSLVVLYVSCSDNDKNNSHASYFARTDPGVQTGGSRMIPVTANGKTFNVWTKRNGNNPRIKVLLLNGGPGMTHEYHECFENFFPAEHFEFIYYDQLGTGRSDDPNDTAYWDLPRYVEEVEQVRQALGLNKDNFYLLGTSWGGILAMEYALKYQQNLKGVVISNMMASAPEYGKYANEVLAKQFDPVILDSIRMMEKNNDFGNPRYMALLMEHYYTKHICRFPLDKWPDPVNRAVSKINQSLYVTMQGPSEFGIAGKLATWDRKADLKNIKVPALIVGARHDTMDPEHMKWMSTQVQNGSFLFCPNGSHLSMYDDQRNYFTGLIKWIKAIDEGKTRNIL